MTSMQSYVGDAPILSPRAYVMLASAKTATIGGRRVFVIVVFSVFAVLSVIFATVEHKPVFWWHALLSVAAIYGGFSMNRLRRRTLRMNGLHALAHSLAQIGVVDATEARRFATHGEVTSAPFAEVVAVRAVLDRAGGTVVVTARCSPPQALSGQEYRREERPDGAVEMIPVGPPRPDGRELSFVDADVTPLNA